MVNSYSEKINLQCPSCKKNTAENIWMIVDISERPDLLEQLMLGTIHDLTCSLCGEPLDKVAAPLLIFCPNARPKLMFSPTPQTVDKEEAEQHFWWLVNRLRSKLGDNWRDEWVESGVMNVAREFLPDFLADGESAERRTKEIAQFFEQLTEEQRQLFIQLYQNRDDPAKLTKLLSKRPEIAAAMNRRDEGEASKSMPTDLNAILQRLSQPIKSLKDMPYREQLCRQALVLVSHSQSPELWASLQTELGKCLFEKLTDNREQNIESSIEAYLEALRVFTRRKYPKEWGLVNVALGPAYFERIKGEHIDNVEKAITALEDALEVITREREPLFWAMAQGNLSNAYNGRVKGNQAQNIEQAVKAGNKALEVLTRAHKIHWARVQNALANAYFNRIEGERHENLEKSIESALRALEFFTREETSEYWAMVQMNLGNAYLERIEGQPARNIEGAIMSYARALEFLSRSDSPKEWAMVQMNLAIAYSRRIYSDTAENIEAAIKASNLALSVYTREDFPHQWAMVQSTLSIIYLKRIRDRRTDNIEKAIIHAQDALEVWTRTFYPKEWASAQLNLANAYGDRIEGDRAQNIEASIAIYLEILEVYTRKEYPERWATVHENLAISYGVRIRENPVRNVELAIESACLSTEVYTQKNFPRNWAGIQHTLCILYTKRIEGQQTENIEKAIDAALQALKVITREKDGKRWAAIQHDLGNAYHARIEGIHAQNIDRAIAAYEKSLEVRKRENFPTDWAATTNSLANAYVGRITGNRIQNMEKAIAAFWQALEVFTKEDNPEKWASIHSNLIPAYRRRIRGDRSQNMEMALESALHALEVYTIEDFPEKHARTLNNLGNLYRTRIQGKRSENLKAAIASFNSALQSHTREDSPQEWARIQGNLASTYMESVAAYSKIALQAYTRENFSQVWATWKSNILSTRKIHYDGVLEQDIEQNIEAAIALYSDVLKGRQCQQSRKDWAMTKMNLSTAYLQRISGNRAQNIETAITGYSAVLEVYTQEDFPEDWALANNNIGTAYVSRILGDSAENIRNAISSYSNALRIFEVNTFPQNCRFTATLLANLYADGALWQEAVSKYKVAIEAAEVLYQAAIFQSSRTSELFEIGDLYRRAAFAHAKNGELKEAVKLLEQGRARGLREALARDHADLLVLEKEEPTLYQRYQTAVTMTQALEAKERADVEIAGKPRLSELRNQAQNARVILDQAIQEIRQIPGYEKFLMLPEFSDISEAVVTEQPLVYLVTTPNGSLCLVVNKSEMSNISVHPLFMEEFSESVLNKLVIDDNNESWFAIYSSEQKDPVSYKEQWLEMLERTSDALWGSLMQPVVKVLKDRGNNQAVLIPCGLLGFLPLHAARTRDDSKVSGYCYALDALAFTYAPNARSLYAARDIAELANANSLLAVNEPYPTEAAPLPNSEREVIVAVSSFPQSHLLKYEQASRNAVLAELPSHNVLHFSCHGKSKPLDPLDGGLIMANDEVLSLRDFFDLQLRGVRLAILSACETSLLGTELPDEVISLSTGLLQAGVAGIIASQWFVSDLSAALLLVRFYDYWRKDKIQPSQALYQAQLWVRDTTNDEKLTYFEKCRADAASSSVLADTFNWLYNSLFDYYDPAECSFTHPCYWAAFSYFGA